MNNVAYECQRSIELARLGYLLANERLDADDAGQIIYEIQPISGWFPLETLSVESVIEAAHDRWGDDAAAIPRLAEDACRRVWNKWSSTGDVAGAAEDWALDLIAEYAAEGGVQLSEEEVSCEEPA